jgi:hypothetical protein
MTDGARLPWLLGIANGVFAVTAVDLVYTAVSSPGIFLVPMWLAAPYGAFTAWRASAYVRRLLNGSPSHVRPAVEGFALMALSTMAYGAYMAVRAGFDGPPFGTAMLLYGMYAVPVGCFGALIAVALMLFDIGFVKVLVRRKMHNPMNGRVDR